jgi:DNA excision repair protein ERCC-2
MPTLRPLIRRLSVRDFALPVPRVGSIEPQSGYGRASLDGQEIHKRFNKFVP